MLSRLLSSFGRACSTSQHAAVGDFVRFCWRPGSVRRGGKTAGKGGGGVGGGRTKQVKSREAGPGGGKRMQKRGRSKHLHSERRIRWRVLEVTPKTPGPVASADFERRRTDAVCWVTLGADQSPTFLEKVSCASSSSAKSTFAITLASRGKLFTTHADGGWTGHALRTRTARHKARVSLRVGTLQGQANLVPVLTSMSARLTSLSAVSHDVKAAHPL